MERKYNEKIIIRDGKIVYAIQLNEKNNKNFITIRDGKIYFTDSWYSGIEEFNFNDEAHNIAKEIFMQQLQTDIKTKIGELKLLEEVFKSIDLKECIGTVIPDSSKILLEAKKDIKEEVSKQIEEQVKPIARKKKKTSKEAE